MYNVILQLRLQCVCKFKNVTQLQKEPFPKIIQRKWWPLNQYSDIFSFQSGINNIQVVIIGVLGGIVYEQEMEGRCKWSC